MMSGGDIIRSSKRGRKLLCAYSLGVEKGDLHNTELLRLRTAGVDAAAQRSVHI